MASLSPVMEDVGVVLGFSPFLELAESFESSDAEDSELHLGQ